MSSIEAIVRRLRESKEPCRGIFWFVKEEYEDEFHILYLDIPESSSIEGNSRNGLTYTHEKTWSILNDSQSRYIKSCKWNHFPRGRVELKDRSATVFLNPNINREPCKSEIVDAFNLHSVQVRFISDGSSHYECYLDEE